MLFTRRSVMGGASLLVLGAGPDAANAWRFEFPSIEEGTLRLADFRGKVMLVVNTASFCSYTPQYRQLEAMHLNTYQLLEHPKVVGWAEGFGAGLRCAAGRG